MRGAAPRSVTRPSQHTAETAVSLSPPRRALIRRRLLGWYDRHRRDLPWRRRAHDPYAQWVAEMMLQQTRVDAVLDRYEPFLRRFPTVEAFARARYPTVLKHWEGLGYYRRILFFHRAARELQRQGRGIPTAAAELRRLPGVGEYTAAAIASIAFGERIAAVDGNVARVVARLFGVGDDVLTAKGKRRIGEFASQLVPTKRPGDFNQAWMDLGSSVCTPTSPKCDRCPLESSCVAAATDRVQQLPVRGANRGTVRPKLSILVAVLVRGDRLLVHRRPLGGLWSGLWEFVNEEGNGGAGGVRRLADGLGVRLEGTPRKVATVRHQLTHRSIVFHVYVGVAQGKQRAGGLGASYRWVTLRGFGRLSVSTAHRRIYEATRPALDRVGVTTG